YGARKRQLLSALCGRQRAKEPVVFAGNSGREEETVRGPADLRAAAEHQGPKALDLDRAAVGLAKEPAKLSARWVEGADAAVTEVPDEHVVAELTEIAGRERDPPRSIQGSLRCETPHEVSIGIEDVDVTEPRSLDVVFLVLVLLRVGHVELRTDRLDSEWREAGR